MKFLLSYLAAVVVLFMPAMTLAASPFSSVEMSSQSSTGAGDSTSYTLIMTPEETLSAGTSVYVYTLGYTGGPFESSFSFSDAYALSAGVSISDVTAVSSDTGLQLTLGSDWTSQASIGLGTVTNGNDGCYQFLITTEEITGPITDISLSGTFGIGTEGCNELDATGKAFGTNVDLSWDGINDASSYVVYYSTDSEEAQRGEGGSAESKSASENAVIIEGLDTNTTYYFSVRANALNESTGEETVGTIGGDPVEVTTDSKAMTKKKAATPTVPKKKRKKKKVTVKWSSPDYVEFVDTVIVQIRKRKGKKIKTYKKVNGSKTKKVVKGLKPGKKYKARVRFKMITGEKTKYSKYKNFKTKAAKN